MIVIQIDENELLYERTEILYHKMQYFFPNYIYAYFNFNTYNLEV